LNLRTTSEKDRAKPASSVKIKVVVVEVSVVTVVISDDEVGLEALRTVRAYGLLPNSSLRPFLI
jgi:hypothetical protein